MQVSFYPTIRATVGTDVALAGVLADIRAGRWQELVAAVRQATTPAARRAAKLHLPYFTASGTFAPRCEAGLHQHSGLLALDLDADPNPDLDWPATRAALQADGHTWACFSSAGGRGLCVLTPAADPARHRASYHAARAYYEGRFQLRLDCLPDVSRPRFVSVDADLYHNPAAHPVPLPPPADEAPPSPAAGHHPPAAGEGGVDPALGAAVLRRAVGRVLAAPDGHKHTTLNKMAYLCGGYVAGGLLPEAEASEALTQAIAQRQPVDLAAACRTIAAGLRDGQRRPLLPDHLQYAVRRQRRAGLGAEAVLARLAHLPGTPPATALRPAVLAVYAEPAHTLCTFWDVLPRPDAAPGGDHPGAAPGGLAGTPAGQLVLHRARYLAWLAAEDFALHRQGTRYALVRVRDNVVQEATRAELKHHVLAYVEELPFEFDGVFRHALQERIQREHRQLFDEGTLEFLPPLPDVFVRDTRQAAYFFFRNAWVQVTAQGPAVRPYRALPGLIWASQRLARDFELPPVPAGPQLAALPPAAWRAAVGAGGEFGRFLTHLCAHDDARLDALTAALGYLLHRHRHRAACFAVAFCDEALTRAGAAGRTGKGLLVQALEKLRQVVKLDGRNFDITRQFAWQRVRADSELVVLDDLDARRLPFERLFSLLSTGMEIETKGGTQQYLDFHQAPKLLITTNDALVGEGPSHEGRKLELELASYYGSHHSPHDEFGHDLFDDWDAAEWLRFDNLLLGCVQRYLAGGVRRPTPINLPRRKLQQKTSEEFVDFAEQEINLGQWYGRRALWQQFCLDSGFDERLCSLRRFGGWLQDLAYYRGYALQQRRQTAGFLPGQRDTDVRFDPAP